MSQHKAQPDNAPGPANPLMVDDREGSADLIPLLEDRRVPVLKTRLEFGDLAWIGNGHNGPASIGVEYKSVRDVLKCMTDGRYSGHQLPGMMRTYDAVYLMVRGILREEPVTRVLQEARRGGWTDVAVGQTRFTYRQLDAFLTTLDTKARVIVRRVGTQAEAVAMLHTLYLWWTEKDWAEHKSMAAIYTPPPPSVMFVKPSLLRRMANCLDKVGWEKSAAIEQKFKTVLSMALATEREWQEIPGIGPTIAHNVVESIQGRETDE
jgi:ERCC4-type nuclease